MGTFEDLRPGDRFESGTRVINEELLQQLVRAGGYVHPIFTDAEFAQTSPLGGTPFPGEAILLLMGGLVEQTARFDNSTIALLGFEEVNFRTPAFAGDEISVGVTVLSKEVSSSGTKGVMTMKWECRGAEGSTIVDCKARMLFSLEAISTDSPKGIGG